MRISINIKEHGTFEEAAAAFLRFKQANQISKRTMDDYIKTFKKFAAVSSNTMEFETLSSDLLNFFSQIPDTSPAVFNRPFSNLNALFNWCVKQDMLQKNPLAALDLHKKKDEGNITAASIDEFRQWLAKAEGFHDVCQSIRTRRWFHLDELLLLRVREWLLLLV